MKPIHDVYQLLLDYSQQVDYKVDALTIGLVWTACRTIKDDQQAVLGLAMSPQQNTRVLPWSGTLVGKSLSEVAEWVLSWEAYQAVVGLSAINCSINAQHTLTGGTVLSANNLAVFDYFLPQLLGKKVVIIGRYPNLEKYREHLDLIVLERQPQAHDYPDSACEYLLPTADWVFITGSSLANKTFPRLAELAQHAQTVLMGPSVPWLREFKDFGIDYLASIDVENNTSLWQTINEGGGVRIFENGARYRVLNLHE